MKRKIAAIMAADIAGYSKLIADDEEETLCRLASYRAVFDDFIARASGRVFNTAGDAIFAEFPTAVDAVRCAIDVQESLRTRNLAFPSSRHMTFRIGMTIGDVVERVVVVELPRGHTLDEASLPRRVGQGQAVELREAALRSRWQLGGTHHELTLHYQVMLSPPALRALELPPVTLRVKGPARTEELRVDAWPLLVGPLSPPEARLREGLGEMRPDASAPLVDTSAAQARLLAGGAAATHGERALTS